MFKHIFTKNIATYHSMYPLVTIVDRQENVKFALESHRGTFERILEHEMVEFILLIEEMTCTIDKTV